MRNRFARRSLVWAPLLAVLVQLAQATAAAAGTGGGSFPRSWIGF